MNQAVTIKANNYGIIAVLDPEPEFEELKQKFAEKFRESAKFLGEATMAISFEGRELTEVQEKELLYEISQNSSLKIVCVIDKDLKREELFRQTLEEKLLELDSRNGQFYKGNLRSGRVAEFETSVIILGDVNPGAKVVSKGNIVVLGALKGTAVAGVSGNTNAFVVALDMSPMQIRIGDVIARSPDNPEKERVKEPKIAFMEEGNIYIEKLDKDVLSDIQMI